jgi:hypothetical protein
VAGDEDADAQADQLALVAGGDQRPEQASVGRARRCATSPAM